VKTVDCWCARLDVSDETAGALYETLSPDERTRAARLRFERDRRRFVVARGVLRALLGRYLEIPAGSVRFVYNPFGKPALAPELGGLKFNLSHSADLALIAVAEDAEVGVDVELIREDPDWVEIAGSAQAFFSDWTKKEAYVKARGEGLGQAGAVPRVAGVWSQYTLRPAPGYIGALVVEGGRRRLRQWQWEDEGSGMPSATIPPPGILGSPVRGPPQRSAGH
jgi:4'-phosphopantetheinyl transferase